MTAGWKRVRAELRTRWKSSAALMLLIALVGTVVLSSAAAARRADSAVDRFVDFSRPLDVQVVYGSSGVTADDLAQLPGVAAVDEMSVVTFAVSKSDGTPDLDSKPLLTVYGPVRGPEHIDFERGLVVQGASPDPSDPLAVGIDEELARTLRLEPGDTFTVWTFEPIDPTAEPATEDEDIPLAPVNRPGLNLTVAGIERRPIDLRPIPDDPDVVSGSGSIYLTPAFMQTYGDSIDRTPVVKANVRLIDRSKLNELEAAVAALPNGSEATFVVDSTSALAARKAQRAVHLEVLALVVFAVLAAAGGVLLLSKLLSRQLAGEAESHRVLRTLGMTRGQLMAIGVVKAVMVAVPAVILAGLGSVAVSELTPIGTARKAEVASGIRIDWPVLVIGSPALLAVVALLAGWQAQRHISRHFVVTESMSTRATPVADTVAGACTSPVPLVAARFWLGQRLRGPARSPVRSAVFGSILAVASVATVIVYSSSLDRVLQSPSLQGWNWDAAVGTILEVDEVQPGIEQLGTNQNLDGYSAIVESVAPIRVADDDTPAATFEPGAGDTGPLVLEGRMPKAPDEVALGFQLLREHDLHLHDRVTVGGEAGDHRYEIVGEVRFWPGFESALTPGGGALFNPEGLARLQPEPEVFGFYMVSLTPGVDRDAAIADLRSDFGIVVPRPILSEDLVNAQRAAATPKVIAYLVAIIALINLAYALIVSVQLRRSELGTLAVLGFGKRQLRAAVAWETGTVAVVGLLVGLPLGVAVGRWSWALASRSLQSVTSAEIPVVPLLLVVPVTLLLAAACAAVPAYIAARRPATVLRAE
jgi:hypothetical protein